MATYRKVRPRWADAPASERGAQTAPPAMAAVIDVGATSIRLAVAEIGSEGAVRVIEEASRGVLLGKDTFTNGRIGPGVLDMAVRVLEGYARILEGYGVQRRRAVATSAIREATNRDSVLDRIRLRTGIDVEIIDGSEENRLTWLAVRSVLRGHKALEAKAALLVALGGGSADLTLLRSGEPVQSGTYPLGAIRMRQSLSSWHGTPESRIRLLRRHIHNVALDVAREIPMGEATQFIALGGDIRFAAERILGEAAVAEDAIPSIPRDAFLALCDEISGDDTERLAEEHRLAPSEAETLVPALIAYREILSATGAATIVVPQVSLRSGLLLDLAHRGESAGLEDLRRQVLAGAETLGEKYRWDALHGRHVARLSVQLFDALKDEHGMGVRERLLLEVASLLHDVGMFVSLRGHHKHTQYLLSAAEIFGLSREDMAVVANVARYHRRSMPLKSHPGYIALDREARVVVNKLAAILRLVNALDSDHLQKITDLRLLREEDPWVLEVTGSGDLTMERIAALARSDLITEVFGRRIAFRQAAP